MVRSFTDRQVDGRVLDDMLDLARRAPSAGNTAAVEYLVLDTPDSVAAYWATTMSEERQIGFRWQGLFRAPVLVVVATRPGAYVERYAEADKARPQLGSSTEGWRQPFWWIDAGMVAQNLLLTVNDRGLGACLFGLFDHEDDVKTTFDVPNDRRLVCTIAIGEPDGSDRPGRSAGRKTTSVGRDHASWPLEDSIVPSRHRLRRSARSSGSGLSNNIHSPLSGWVNPSVSACRNGRSSPRSG